MIYNFSNYMKTKLDFLGNRELLQENKLIAVVGSREMSVYGQRMIEILIPQLVEKGWVIVSGMAFGVDAWSHKIALDNKGGVIAVLASGVDMPTPKGNYWLYERILKENGLIVSLQKKGQMPKPIDFLKRNEIIADLCQKVLVIEGDNHSGVLVTARMAVEKNKEVYCLPGRVGDKNSFAPNFLIKNGANLVMEVDDII
jgi:DNA processing protein